MPATDFSTHETQTEMLCEMLRIRVIEQGLAEYYAEQEMRCPVHFSVGQEAAAVGVCAASRPEDTSVSTHRCHAHYLAKGGDLKRMVAEMYGRETGCAKGNGGSMHLIDRSVNFLGAIAIVGSSFPVGVGIGFSNKLQNVDSVSMVYFGEATTEEGVVHEGLNFAALHDLPVLFVCENNGYSVYSPLDVRQHANREIWKTAEAQGMKAKRLNGNDVQAVAEATAEALEHIRSGKGPYFLELDTYRWLEHCGPNYDNDIGYRTEDEFLSWKAKDPIELTESRLIEAGAIDAKFVETKRREYRDELDEAVAFAKASPFPSPDQILKYVYA